MRYNRLKSVYKPKESKAPAPAPTPPIITNRSLRDMFMAPGAMEIKRRTPTFTGGPVR